MILKLFLPVFATVLIGLSDFYPSLPSGPCDSPFVGGHTGAPGESSCTGCHGGNANIGPGSLQLELSDTTMLYTPGEIIDATVTLRQSGRDKFGFVGLALRDEGNSTVGSFTIDDLIRTRTFSDGPRQYVSHTPCGADATPPDSLSWTFHWQAPATNVGNITLYLAGLAANHNHALSGDDTYTLAVHLVPDSIALGIGNLLSAGDLHIWPNPVLDIIHVELNGSAKESPSYQAEIWSTNGLLIRSISMSENNLSIADLQAGVYLLRVYDRGKEVLGQSFFVKQ